MTVCPIVGTGDRVTLPTADVIIIILFTAIRVIFFYGFYERARGFINIIIIIIRLAIPRRRTRNSFRARRRLTARDRCATAANPPSSVTVVDDFPVSRWW